MSLFLWTPKKKSSPDWINLQRPVSCSQRENLSFKLEAWNCKLKKSRQKTERYVGKNDCVFCLEKLWHSWSVDRTILRETPSQDNLKRIMENCNRETFLKLFTRFTSVCPRSDGTQQVKGTVWHFQKLNYLLSRSDLDEKSDATLIYPQ